MFKKGLNVVLNQPIEGKKDRFEQGLKGMVVEELDLPHGKSYRVQFVYFTAFWKHRIAVPREH